MIDLELDRMYAEGALNTFIDDLSAWIHEKEAALEQRREKPIWAPVVKSLQIHIDETKSLLSKAENFRAHKEGRRF